MERERDHTKSIRRGGVEKHHIGTRQRGEDILRLKDCRSLKAIFLDAYTNILRTETSTSTRRKDGQSSATSRLASFLGSKGLAGRGERREDVNMCFACSRSEFNFVLSTSPGSPLAPQYYAICSHSNWPAPSPLRGWHSFHNLSILLRVRISLTTPASPVLTR